MTHQKVVKVFSKSLVLKFSDLPVLTFGN